MNRTAGPPGRHPVNQIGEVLPTILRDGSVIGTWRWETTTRRVQWRLFTPEPAA